MSAVPEERIRRPEDLPLAHTEKQMREVFGHLTQKGASDFADEIIVALFASRGQGDFRPLVETVEAWYRTLLFMSQEGFPEGLDRAAARKTGGPDYSLEEIRARQQRER